MTKKHYEAIAAIMAEHTQGEALAVLYRLADYFKTDNPRFDRDRFLKACGVENKKSLNN